MKFSIFLIVFSLVILIFYFVICLYIASSLTTPKPTPITISPDKISNNAKDVVFRAKDGLQLAGWYFEGTNGKAIIFVHGAGNQNRVNEAYGTPMIAKHFLDKGYSILLFDLRGTGNSQKTRLSLGLDEAKDVLGAFSYVQRLGYNEKRIGIISNSLGAIATIIAADNVKGAGAIVLDSPASVVKPIVSTIMLKDHKVPIFLHQSIFFTAKLVYGIDVEKVRPIDYISLLKDTPTLFLFGEKDMLIPKQNSLDLSSKLEKAKIHSFSNATHEISTYKSDHAAYFSTVDAFFEKNLAN